LKDERTRVNQTNEWGQTSLWLACYYGRAKVLERLLLDPRVDANLPDRENVSPLWIACARGNMQAVSILLALRENLEVQRRKFFLGFSWLPGRNAVQIARKNGHKEIADLIVGYEKNRFMASRGLRKKLEKQGFCFLFFIHSIVHSVAHFFFFFFQSSGFFTSNNALEYGKKRKLEEMESHYEEIKKENEQLKEKVQQTEKELHQLQEGPPLNLFSEQTKS